MPDPLAVLPYELWPLCIALAIAGQPSGPLELLMVSKHWENLLLDSPSLWSQIYIQNGEDEIARISVFLHLSKSCSLHVDIMTVLPITDSLQLIAKNISRVATISIRPGASDTITGFPIVQWKLAASNITSTLFNGRPPPNVEDTECFGISLRENGQWEYHVILMQFTTASMVASSDEQHSVASANLPDEWASVLRWEKHITRCTYISAGQDSLVRTASIKSIGQLASYAQYHDAIRIAIPSFIKLMKDVDSSIRAATADALDRLAVHVELREALKLTIQSLIELLEHRYNEIRTDVLSVLDNLAEHGEFHEPLRITIPSLVRLFEHWNFAVRVAAISVLETMSKHGELRDAVRVAIPSLVRLCEHWHSPVRFAAHSILETMSKHGEFSSALTTAIPSLIQLLRHSDPNVHLAALSVLGSLAKNDHFHEALRTTDPTPIKVLPSLNFIAQSAAPFPLGSLAKHGEFHEALSAAIPSLIKLLQQHSGFKAQLTTLSILGNIAKHGRCGKIPCERGNEDRFHDALRATIPSIVQLLEHPDRKVRSAAASALETLETNVELQ